MLRWVRLVALAGLAGASSAGSQTVDPPAADVSRMFRGTPAHTGVATNRVFDGQGGEYTARVKDPVTGETADVRFQVTNLSLERRSAARNVA